MPHQNSICHFTATAPFAHTTMKDRTVAKAQSAFFEIVQDLDDGLKAQEENHVWRTEVLQKRDQGAEARAEVIRTWIESIETPLVKGAKYRTAVSSILGTSATAYHALKYRDASAMAESCPLFRDLGVVKHGAAGSPTSTLFWEYLDELTDEAYTATRKTAVRVPTSEEIAQNIASRKQRRNTAHDPVLGQGAVELVSALFTERGLTPPSATDLHSLVLTLVNDGRVTSDVCKARGCKEALEKAFPDLCPLRDSDWEVFTKVFALSTMESAIPNEMMKGIESVATQLVEDITTGRASMNSLNVEEIGQRVLAGVSSADVDEFSKNIDKILPAITNMNMGGGNFGSMRQGR